MSERFIQTVNGQAIFAAAVAALDTHLDLAKQILMILNADHDGDGNGVVNTDANRVLIDHAQVHTLLDDPRPARHIERRVAYAATNGRVPDQVVSTLTPAQRKILATLVRAPRPLDVGELATSCGLKKKTVTNALSMLKGRALIGAHDKRS